MFSLNYWLYDFLGFIFRLVFEMLSMNFILPGKEGSENWREIYLSYSGRISCFG